MNKKMMWRFKALPQWCIIKIISKSLPISD